QDVWLVPAAGGEAKKVTMNPAADQQPTYSPDGKILAIKSQRRAGFESDRWYLDLYDQGTGARRTLFESPDLSVDEFIFSPDGRMMFFTAAEKGFVNMYSIPVLGGVPKLVAKGGTVTQIHAGNDFVLFSKSTITAPPELFRISYDGSAPKQLTNENA